MLRKVRVLQLRLTLSARYVMLWFRTWARPRTEECIPLVDALESPGAGEVPETPRLRRVVSQA